LLGLGWRRPLSDGSGQRTSEQRSNHRQIAPVPLQGRSPGLKARAGGAPCYGFGLPSNAATISHHNPVDPAQQVRPIAEKPLTNNVNHAFQEENYYF
jgi:hypothetical protein